MKRLLLYILAGVAVAVAFNLYFDRYVDPSANFFDEMARLSDRWEAQLRSESDAPCQIIAGGSEIRMGVDPAWLKERYGLRVVNSGNTASFGTRVNTLTALRYLRRGDTLVLSLLVPRLPEGDATSGGIKYAWRREGWGMFEESLAPGPAESFQHIIRGSADMLSTYIAKKIFTPDNMYRYDRHTRKHPSGWCELFYNNMAQNAPGLSPDRAGAQFNSRMNQAMADYLAETKEICRRKGVDMVIYFAPVCVETRGRRAHAAYALEFIRAGVPVLRTEPLGCEPDSRLFADTYAHLSPAGVAKHSRMLGEALRDRRCWTESELKHIIAQGP